MSRFFQRRGFKTATVAATAAVLEHTAASAPALLAASIAQTAAQAAPPALAGLAAWLARLAGLTKTQVAAVSLLIAITPAAWHWRHSRTAINETQALQVQLDTARTEQTQLTMELERLQAESVRLNARLAQAADAQARHDETARALARLKSRIRGLLTAQDYRWPDDLPFVRIPKSAVRSFDLFTSYHGTVPLAPPGLVQPTARELLGLTAGERQTVEGALGRYFTEVNQRIESSVYETNRPMGGKLPVGAVATRVFAVPPLGPELNQASDRMVAEITAALGEERWNILKPGTELHGTYSLRRVLSREAAQKPQELILWISQKENTPPTAGYTWSIPGYSSFGRDGIALAEFAPTNASPAGTLQDTFLPGALIERGARWLAQQAEALLPVPSKP